MRLGLKKRKTFAAISQRRGRAAQAARVRTHLFVDGVLFVYVRVAVQLFGLDERRPLFGFLMVVVVRRPGVEPRVQAVPGRLVEARLVQLQEHVLGAETDHGHGVVVRLARVLGHPQLRLGHAVAPEVLVPVRAAPVTERVAAGTGHQRFAAVL